MTESINNRDYSLMETNIKSLIIDSAILLHIYSWQK